MTTCNSEMPGSLDTEKSEGTLATEKSEIPESGIQLYDKSPSSQNTSSTMLTTEDPTTDNEKEKDDRTFGLPNTGPDWPPSESSSGSSNSSKSKNSSGTSGSSGSSNTWKHFSKGKKKNKKPPGYSTSQSSSGSGSSCSSKSGSPITTRSSGSFSSSGSSCSSKSKNSSNSSRSSGSFSSPNSSGSSCSSKDFKALNKGESKSEHSKEAKEEIHMALNQLKAKEKKDELEFLKMTKITDFTSLLEDEVKEDDDENDLWGDMDEEENFDNILKDLKTAYEKENSHPDKNQKLSYKLQRKKRLGNLYIDIDLCPNYNSANPEKVQILEALEKAGREGVYQLERWLPKLWKFFPDFVLKPKKKQNHQDADNVIQAPETQQEKGYISLVYKATKSGRERYLGMRDHLFMTGGRGGPNTMCFRYKERVNSFLSAFIRPTDDPDKKPTVMTMKIPVNMSHKVAMKFAREVFFKGLKTAPKLPFFQAVRLPRGKQYITKRGMELNSNTMLFVVKPKSAKLLKIIAFGNEEKATRIKCKNYATIIDFWNPNKQKSNPAFRPKKRKRSD
eukprot:CAMPEP_0197523420 /NCGR_PEP_ID=MMETSP1318-20131121/8353_1 /TAXON_ID=552666 /ORGANISM="Partenskyella glossopodia, Strain RCC365" /LENGTH=559 /DNA_ID=CAMNT_0043076107 /DNA_START=92 /DNA_END=1771 /DNA_ORIENTATION=+